MQVQKHSHSTLIVPWVLKYLCDSTLEAGGVQAVGIFRISAAEEEMAELRKELEARKTPKLTDPHVAAHLIKTWLLEIETPLIPAKL